MTNPVHEIFNDIANRMRMTDNGEEYISNTVQLQGASGKIHELSYDQTRLLLGVLAGDHPFLSNHNPLEFLLFSYQFQDKIKLKYLAVQYQVIYDAEDDSIFVSGITKHPMCVKGHPEYVEGATIPIETFQTTIPNVGLYGALALVNCIATQHESFAPIKGSFGGSFIYEFENGRQSVRKYEPEAIEQLEQIGIQKEDVREALLDAMKKLRPADKEPFPIPKALQDLGKATPPPSDSRINVQLGGAFTQQMLNEQMRISPSAYAAASGTAEISLSGINGPI
ncbi:hypothetical protein [Pseudomonas phage D6]|nr:hypothetical protein [Pseudomonas phage D6]